MSGKPTDIVERLRELQAKPRWLTQHELEEVIDEIERLRAALSDVRSYLRDKKTWHAPPTAEQLADTVLDMLEVVSIDLT